MNNARKYNGGGDTNPNGFANGENGIRIPTVTIKIEVKIRNLLGRLSMNGILPVRMI
jgi:hypothetical protein